MREPCTRAGAVEAGWRYAEDFGGETLVLQHLGGAGNAWFRVASNVEHGRAVEAFTVARARLAGAGALALWSNGRVSRYETADQCVDSKVAQRR
jgi:hypothetical protein